MWTILIKYLLLHKCPIPKNNHISRNVDHILSIYLEKLFWAKCTFTIIQIFLYQCIAILRDNQRTKWWNKKILFLLQKACIFLLFIMMWSHQKTFPKIFVGLVIVSMTLSALYLRMASSCWTADTNNDKRKFFQMLNHKIYQVLIQFQRTSFRSRGTKLLILPPF